jgi:protein gp88
MNIRDTVASLDLTKHKIWLHTNDRARVGGTRQFPEPRLSIEPALTLALPSGKTETLRNAKLFTYTTKMLCASWSLPAGTPKNGGTCLAASADRGGGGDGRWICDGCYATEGNYMYPIVLLTQRVRLEWTKRAVAGDRFAREMIAALGQLLATPRYVQIGKSGQQKSVCIDTRYFRLHDSGDFSGLGLDYLDAWIEIARAITKTTFWAPTRDHIFPEFAKHMANAPKNLVLRPSALRVDDPPPVLWLGAAGTTVSSNPETAVWDCPSSRNHSSCQESMCRTCWDRPDVSVNYTPHRPLSGLVSIRRNGEEVAASQPERSGRSYAEMIVDVLKKSERPLKASEIYEAVLRDEDVHRSSLTSYAYWMGKSGRLKVEEIGGVKRFSVAA